MKTYTKYITALFFIGGLAHGEALGTYDRNLASEAEYQHGITPAIGMNRGHVVLEGDYEYRLTEHFGFGGSGFFTPKDDDHFYAGIVGVGVDAKIHIPLNDLDFYARPGMSIAFVNGKTVLGKDDDTTILAPFMGIGTIYRISQNVGLGVEYLTTFNWTSDKLLDDSRADFLLNCQIKF